MNFLTVMRNCHGQRAKISARSTTVEVLEITIHGLYVLVIWCQWRKLVKTVNGSHLVMPTIPTIERRVVTPIVGAIEELTQNVQPLLETTNLLRRWSDLSTTELPEERVWQLSNVPQANPVAIQSDFTRVRKFRSMTWVRSAGSWRTA